MRLSCDGVTLRGTVPTLDPLVSSLGLLCCDVSKDSKINRNWQWLILPDDTPCKSEAKMAISLQHHCLDVKYVYLKLPNELFVGDIWVSVDFSVVGHAECDREEGLAWAGLQPGHLAACCVPLTPMCRLSAGTTGAGHWQGLPLYTAVGTFSGLSAAECYRALYCQHP